ncbi:MAG: N-acetyltransferase [Elusimicrobiota bacterium]
MKNPVVRPATPGDLDAIVELLNSRPFTARWSRRALEDELRRRDGIVLVCGRQGYALARLVPGECHLLDIASAKDGEGVGRALFEALQAAARARECRKITFEVSTKNARALSFYRAAGAVVVGGRKKFYNDGSDAVLMDLNLK